VAAIATAACIPAIIGALAGFSNIKNFVEITRKITAEYTTSPTNFSLTGQVSSLFGSGTALETAGKLLCAAIILIACLDVLRRKRWKAAWPQQATDDIAFAVLVLGSLLLTPLCGSHYFVVLLLPIAILFCYGVDVREGLPVLVFSLALLIISVPDPPIVDIQQLLSKLAGSRAGNFLGALPTWTMLMMFGWLWKLSRRAPEEKTRIAAAHPVSQT
jgi:hypothetical protein